MTEQTQVLRSLGFDPAILPSVEADLNSGLVLARVGAEHREGYDVVTATGEYPAVVAGKFRFEAARTEDFPAVGDWVLVSRADERGARLIHRLLPRRTVLLRKVAGERTRRQVIAANVDIVFVVHPLDRNFNLRTLERYVVAARESGARPVVLLSKSDLCSPEEIEEKLIAAGEAAPGTEVLPYSAVTGVMLGQVRAHLSEGCTGCCIGPSGVGKSTLINRLAGNDLLPMRDVRTVDTKGRHATARRELVMLPGGGILIDTPGMRELGLWQAGAGLDETFSDVTTLAADCRFRDCTHREEPGCAVMSAVDAGSLDRGRYESYQKLRREAEVTEQRATVAGRRERKRREKIMGRAKKEVKRRKGR